VFELQPMAFIMEQAGGLAIDGDQDILSVKVETINQLSPIYIGSIYEVQLAKHMLSTRINNLWVIRSSALRYNFQ